MSNNIMIGVFIYILRVHHVFHAHTTHELLEYVGGGVAPRVCYFVLVYRYYLSDIIVHPVQLLLSRNSLHKYQASLRVI
jgi:hypothetical protein